MFGRRDGGSDRGNLGDGVEKVLMEEGGVEG